MSIVASDLVLYAAVNEPSDSVSTGGGAIDVARRLDFTQIAATDKIEVGSSAAGDTTQTATVRGRKADGSIVSEILTLTGTTFVATTNNYERLLKVEMSATCVGTVTVRRQTGPSTLRTIPIGERGFMAPFRELASDPSSITNFYAKGFWKNTNGSLALTSAVVVENADPSADITFGLGAALDDTLTIATRIIAPAGVTFASTNANVPNSQNLSSGSAIGTWFNLTLAAGAAALKSTYTTEIDGQTT